VAVLALSQALALVHPHVKRGVFDRGLGHLWQMALPIPVRTVLTLLLVSLFFHLLFVVVVVSSPGCSLLLSTHALSCHLTRSILML